MKKEIVKVGKIYIQEPSSQNSVKNGAEYLRGLVYWIDNRDDSLNINKSHLELIVEYNIYCNHKNKLNVKLNPVK